jgi:CBS domain-containing protein
MALLLKATPLAALEAVVLDTETTGLDTRTARVIEIGLAGFGQELAWSALVNPREPIPAASQKVHGISDAMVALESEFSGVWAEARQRIGQQVVIGHSLGFDLAILKRECERAGMSWHEPLWLDTRFLTVVLGASLPDFSLDTLAGWLDVSAQGKHRALGDAQATAAIFDAMIPRLRERGIHTLGEALAACRSVQDANDGLVRAGWAEAPRATRLVVPTQGRQVGGIDTHPFQNRVSALMSSPPVFIPADTKLQDALKLIVGKRISGVFVGDPERPATEAGIVTERDLLRAISQRGQSALDMMIDEIANRPLVTIPAGAFAYRAIGRMSRLNLRHLAVVGEDHPRVVGALTQRDLLRLRAQTAITLGDDVDSATTVAALGRAWAKLAAMAEQLLDEGLEAVEIAGIIARELGALTRRATMLAEERMKAGGLGSAPCRFSVLILGSAGRGESLLAMDQDNAIIFESGEPGGKEDSWFAMLGRLLADILNEVGVPYCKGGVMAMEPAFRGSVETWRERMQTWLSHARPEDLLNVDIVFDSRGVYGDPDLFTSLMTEFRDNASERPEFLKLLVESHSDSSAPVGLFGGLKGDEQGRIDLKRHITSRVVATARVLALRHGVVARSTPARLRGVAALGKGGVEDLEGLAIAYELALGVILKAQLNDIAHGAPTTNRVPLDQLSATEKSRLKSDLSLASTIGDLVRAMVV